MDRRVACHTGPCPLGQRNRRGSGQKIFRCPSSRKADTNTRSRRRRPRLLLPENPKGPSRHGRQLLNLRLRRTFACRTSLRAPTGWRSLFRMPFNPMNCRINRRIGIRGGRPNSPASRRASSSRAEPAPPRRIKTDPRHRALWKPGAWCQPAGDLLHRPRWRRASCPERMRVALGTPRDARCRLQRIGTMPHRLGPNGRSGRGYRRRRFLPRSPTTWMSWRPPPLEFEEQA